MFSKSFRVKSNSQLKGSERKKFRAEILKNFTSLKDEDLVEIVPNKEVIVLMKIHTHSGESVLVYCVEKLPVVFVLEGVMFPTVYMLWKIPDLLYSFTTWPNVLPKITGGADLMLPGVVLKDGFHIKAFGKLERGDRASVNLVSNKAAIAVGKAALSSIEMYMSAKRGKAVNILHFVGDELWSYGTKLPSPDLGPPEGFRSDGSEEENEIQNCKSETSVLDSEDGTTISSVAELEEDTDYNTEQLNVACESSSGICLPSSAVSETIVSEFLSKVNLKEDSVQIINSSDSSEKCIDEKEAMDELIEYCFLKALNTTAKKIEYPILSSKFFKLHMITSCPPGKNLDVKKSSFKKLSIFLNKMSSLGVITVRELTKGVESIMNFNPGHELLKNFVDIYIDESIASTSNTVLDMNTRPEITEMYVVTAGVLPIFSKFDWKKGASLPAASVRKYITDYVKMENLQKEDNKRYVQLNETLSKVMGAEFNSFVTWDELMNKVLSRMTRSYHMSFSGQQSVFNKGKLEPIDIQVGKRTGNKKVTLINNLELYGINLNEFARECQHGVAASTSISAVPGKKSAQLMVQGNQVLFVGNLLTGKYNLPKRYIRGLENAPKTSGTKGNAPKSKKK